MKRILLTITLLLCAIALMAQVPAGFSYQAVVRNGSGDVIANQPVKFRISILRDSPDGSPVYIEIHSAATNGFGLANLVIGKGIPVEGIFSPGGWGLASHFLKIDLDASGGSDFEHLGTLELMAVPYAFHAQTVEVDQVDDADADATNEIQQLELTGTVLGLSKSSKTVTLPSSGNGGDNWGTDYVHTDATLEGQGTDATPLKIAQQSAATGQVLKWDGSSWTAAADEKEDDDPDATNELQDLSIEGNTLQLTGSETSVSLASYLDNTDSQELSISENSLSISGGNSVTLPSSDSGGDDWGSDYVHTNATLAGQGTSAAPLKIAHQSATSGQVLKWNGTSWTPASDESGEGGSSPFTSSGGITSNSPITDHFVVGSSSLNDVAGTNDDVRMFFNKTKNAFRVGKADADQWDDSNVGTNSIAFGTGTIASGDFSLAMGLRTKALGGWSTAMGYNSEASGSYAFAAGQSIASENYCTAMGFSTEASGRVSTALGANTIALSGYETAIGRYNTTYTIDKKLGWAETDRLFVIGNGVADDQRSNALVMLKNGNTGFGVDNPVHKLEVNGQTKFSGNVGIGVDSPNNILELNGGNISNMKFFSSASGTGDTKGFMIGTRSTPHNAYIWNFENTSLTLATNNLMRMIIAANGNVSIGDHIPSFKLDVKANNRIQLTKTNGTEWIAMRTDGSLLDLSFSGNNLAIKGMADGENILLNPAINSKVGIRTWTPQYDLDVNGNIRATGSIYYGGTTGSADGSAYSKPDFVFDIGYQTFSIEDIEQFIILKKHLPWVTSANKEKEENGDVIDMTRMAFETLETVENLQLQLIKQNKLVKGLKTENDRLKAENEEISTRLEKIESILNLRVQK